MRECLDKVKDWPSLARDGGYRVGEVARELGVSRRWLRICLQVRFHKTARELFAAWREESIREMRQAGKTGKEILPEALAHCSSLTRSLTRDTGAGLRALKKRYERFAP